MFSQPGSDSVACVDPAADVLTSLPVLVLNIHNRCNCRCVMCDIWKRQETSEISVAHLQSHRSAIRALGVRWVVLSGGEPLMHSDLESLCAWLKAEQVRLTLLTSGLLLSRRAETITRFVDDVIVSIDGPPEVHDRVRRVRGAFELIRKGVEALRRYRSNIRVTARTTVQKANFRVLRSTVDAAKDLRLDAISFLAADLTSEAFNRPLLWPVQKQDEIALASEEVEHLQHEIEKLIVEYPSDIAAGYIVENAPKLRRIVQHFRAQLGLEGAIAPLCNAPWTSAVIEADGSVRPCFFHRPIGNIYQLTLDEILNGEQGRAFRHNLVVADDPTCRRCVCSLNYRSPAEHETQ